MKKDNLSKNKKNNTVGPGDDCKCPVCTFSKSNAPGNPYDIKDCPKYSKEIVPSKKIKLCKKA